MRCAARDALAAAMAAVLVFLAGCPLPSAGIPDGEADGAALDAGTDAPPGEAGGETAGGDGGADAADVADVAEADADVPADPPVASCRYPGETIVIGNNRSDDLPVAIVDTMLSSDTPDDRLDGLDKVNVSHHEPAISTGLVKFALSSLAGCQVKTAALELTIDDDSLEGVFEIYPMLQDWSPAATYERNGAGSTWPVPGCFRPGDPPCRATVPMFSGSGIAKGPLTFELDAEVVTSWIAAPEMNFGLLMLMAKEGHSVRFFSSEAPDGRRPRLVLTLSP